jgi:hypothetical protein
MSGAPHYVLVCLFKLLNPCSKPGAEVNPFCQDSSLAVAAGMTARIIQRTHDQGM